MPQVAERRSAYVPKNGSQKNGYPKQYRKDGNRPSGLGSPSPSKPGSQLSASQADKPEPEILFQKYFKSVGPRTYAAQLKRAVNKNQFLVITEGKRDEKTGDVRKTKLFVWSEDFVAFFRMLHEMAKHIRENPVPDDIRQKRERYWAKQATAGKPPVAGAPVKPRFDKR